MAKLISGKFGSGSELVLISLARVASNYGSKMFEKDTKLPPMLPLFH